MNEDDEMLKFVGIAVVLALCIGAMLMGCGIVCLLWRSPKTEPVDISTVTAEIDAVRKAQREFHNSALQLVILQKEVSDKRNER